MSKSCPRGQKPSADLLGQRNDDALGAAYVAEPIAVLVLLQSANEFRTVSAQPGNDVFDVVDGEHDVPYAQRVRRCVQPGADRRRCMELRQLESAVAVRSPHHCDVDPDTVES